MFGKTFDVNGKRYYHKNDNKIEEETNVLNLP